MKPREKALAEGDKVAVYDQGRRYVGIVHAVGGGGTPSGGWIEVKITYKTVSAIRNFYPQQCRRIRNKDKPVIAERYQCWVNSRPYYKTPSECTYLSKEEAQDSAVGRQDDAFQIHLVELREGEKIVSKESLERAWNKVGDLDDFPVNGGAFALLKIALGLDGP